MTTDETREPVEAVQTGAAREPAATVTVEAAREPAAESAPAPAAAKAKRKRLTPAERIAQLEARLQKERARLAASTRKERSGQLVALGVLLEQRYKSIKPESRGFWPSLAREMLTDHTLTRALAAFDRLDMEIQQAEKPAPAKAPAPAPSVSTTEKN